MMSEAEALEALKTLSDPEVLALLPFVDIAEDAFRAYTTPDCAFVDDEGGPTHWSGLMAHQRRYLANFAHAVLMHGSALGLLAEHGRFSDARKMALLSLTEDADLPF
jgi:hypothetical protein